MSFDLQLQRGRPLVTGGTKGVGAAVVQALQQAGMQVLAVARSVPPEAPARASTASVPAPASRPCHAPGLACAALQFLSFTP